MPSLFSTHGTSAFSVANNTLRAACTQLQHEEMSARSTLAHLPQISLYSDKMQPYLRGLPDSGMHLKMQCRTGTIPLNGLLTTRHIASNASCPCCAAEETVEHFILHCPAYMDQRSILRSTLTQITSSSSDSLFADSDDGHTVSCLLSDRYWASLGCFEDANRAMCRFLARAWAIRDAIVSWDFS